MKIDAVKYDGSFLVNLPFNEASPSYIFNDTPSLVEGVSNTSWCLVKTPEITSIKKYQSGGHTNHRYVLIDPSFESEKIPVIIKHEQESKYCYYSTDDEDYGWIFTDEYKHLRSLYKTECDEVLGHWVEIEFELNIIAEIPRDYKEHVFSVERWYEPNSYYDRKSRPITITKAAVNTTFPAKILFPDIIHHELPCSINSDTMYSIVRAYIKTHINPKYAQITSDYDFCFTVMKSIQLFQLEKYMVDVNQFSKRKKKAKLEERYRVDRKIEIFEMTPSSRKYNGYTVIDGMSGANYEDLEKKIISYLESLIEMINEPLCDCPHCKGFGVVTKSQTNVEP